MSPSKAGWIVVLGCLTTCAGIVLGALDETPCDCHEAGEKIEELRTELATVPKPPEATT